MELKATLKTTPKYIKILAAEGITTVKDFLQYFPRAYEDRSTIRNLNELIFNEKGMTATKGKIIKKTIFMRWWRRIYTINFVDPVGNKWVITIFNSWFMASKLHEDKRYIIVGKPTMRLNKITFLHPDVVETEAPEDENSVNSEEWIVNSDGKLDTSNSSLGTAVYNSWRIFPIYPELMWIKPRRFAQKMRNLIDKIDTIFSEYLPQEFIEKFWLMGVKETIRAMHYPESFDQQKQANLRIFFDRLLRIQLYSLINRASYQAWNTWQTPKKAKNSKIEKILKIVTELHIKYGNTLTEKQYSRLIENKLQKEGVSVEREKSIVINDDGVIVWTKYMDLVVDQQIVMELKNTPYIHKQDLKQTRAYLDLWNYETWLLINFGESKINIARLEKDYKKISSDFSENSSDLSVQPDREIIKEIIKSLPFELTMAQKKVIKQITENIHEPKPMLRLLQGDVGSGKTVVAAASAYYTHKKFWGQSVFLAPLEVLANQHYKTLAKLLLPLGLRVELLTWSVPKNQKDKIKQDLLEGRIHTLVWTHAVIQEDVVFKQLQFVVIDEQHKFWVKQRAFFKRFWAPHILQMSATPIPRSMALAFFGEFDVSIIDEMPIGRKPIITKVISEKEYMKLKPRILDHINKGQKVFIVTPLIEESEKLEKVKAATTEFEEAKALYPELKGRIWLLHGKMRPKDKDEVMQDFKSWKISLLVSTTVIEVGVDIPEATIMVIKNAERFWLSQLHQLRWRIGRADIQSYCFLETKSKAGDIGKRLKAMEESNDGFKLAELDLQNRGAGEILGTMQSWESDIPLEILSDLKFLEKIQEGAKRLLEKYPKLEWLPGLKKYLEEKMGDVLA